jgi:hypothetical protein
MVSTAISIYRKIQKKGEINYIDARGKTKLSDAKNYYINQNEFHKTPNKVFFTPNEFNTNIHEKYSKKINELLNKYWDKISTSSNINKHRIELSEYRDSLKEGDVTILGLVSDGGQGLGTGNNGKYIGLLKGSNDAKRIQLNRLKKIKEFNIKFNTDYDISSLREKDIVSLFEELKEKKGRDIFGQGFLYRIVDESMIADVNKLTDFEKNNGIKSEKSYVPYDKGDKDGNRWYLDTPYYIDWSEHNIENLKERSKLQGKGKSLWQNSQFYFREGFCWNDIHTVSIKARLKAKTVHDVVGMSLFPLINIITAKYIVCILNSGFASWFSHEFLNNTSHFQINDARCLPMIVPTSEQLKIFEDIFDRSFDIQNQKFKSIITEDIANSKLEIIQKELDLQVDKLYLDI